jgi:alkylation response protein AidB-like acyl-CoA dehydrogenase
MSSYPADRELSPPSVRSNDLRNVSLLAGGSSGSTATRRMLLIGEGTNEIQRIVIARKLLERNAI